MKTPAAVTGADFAHLKIIARQIRDGHDAVEVFVRAARAGAQDALREAILAGVAVNEAKQILGAKFDEWLTQHCKGVDRTKSQVYVKLAEAPDTKLTTAYVLLGVINEPLELRCAAVAQAKTIANGGT